MTSPAAVRFTDITKTFPGVVALTGVSFDIRRGSCHAICGENGAGKSTLGKILSGIERADAGEVELDGQPYRAGSPREALGAGVAMVHQELSLCDNLTVGENLCLGHLPRRFTFVSRGELRRQARALLSEIGSTIDPGRPLASLSVAEHQVVQIAAAVGGGARVIIFDEPTSSLGETEAANLFALIGQLKDRGVTILYVSHRMAEIFQLSDAVTVLRDGHHVRTQATRELTEASVVELMIGRHIEQYFPRHVRRERGEERLRVDGLSSSGKFSNVSFSVHAGEVVGLAGLVGAGRSEIAQAIFGLDPEVRGSVQVNRHPARVGSPRAAMALGVGFVPEDRKRQGLVLSMRARENVTLPTLERFSSLGWVDSAREAGTAAAYIDRLRVRATSEAVAQTLSGGNQQKLVLAKWLAAKSDILMLDEPTRGVDVGAKAELHTWIDQLASEGAAILLISSELPELLNVSSRIVVMRQGMIVGEVAREHATQDILVRMMTGLGPVGTELGPIADNSHSPRSTVTPPLHDM